MDAFVSVFRITRSSRCAVEKIEKLFGHVTHLLTNRAREGQLTTAAQKKYPNIVELERKPGYSARPPVVILRSRPDDAKST